MPKRNLFNCCEVELERWLLGDYGIKLARNYSTKSSASTSGLTRIRIRLRKRFPVTPVAKSLN